MYIITKTAQDNSVKEICFTFMQKEVKSISFDFFLFTNNPYYYN